MGTQQHCFVAFVAAFFLVAVQAQYERYHRSPSDGGASGGFAGSSSSANSFSSGSARAYAFAGGGHFGGVYAGGFPGGGGVYAGGFPDGFANAFRSYQDALGQFHAQAAMVAAQAAQTAAHAHGGFFPGLAFYGFSSAHPPFVWSNFIPQPSFSWNGGNDIGGGGGGVGASASGYFGPGGGHGSANVHPPANSGLDVRFGADAGSGPVNSASGDFPAPPGGSYGVFTSSSSGQTSVDGKTTSYKHASVGVNDNGKVVTYTAHDP